MGIIFVGGVHGVGKSSACKRAAAITGVAYHTASEIIRAESGAIRMHETKEVRDVGSNQSLLLQGVKKLSAALGDKFLLDGHFTLVGSGGGIERIPEGVFLPLGLDAVVVFRDRPDNIAIRLQERDGRAWSASRIAAQQDAEVEHAQEVARSNGIPLVSLEAFDIQGLVNAISTIWGSSIQA